MFGKKRNGGPTVVGEGSELEGTVRVRDGLQVDGVIDGNVDVTGGMSIGPSGVLRGDVRADRASIAGRIDGNLIVDGHLHLLESGHLDGEVAYGTLQVEKGGELRGRTSQVDAGLESAEVTPAQLQAELMPRDEMLDAAKA